MPCGDEYQVEKVQVPLIKVESADHLIFHVVIHLGARDCRATLLFVIVLGWTLHPAYQANSREFFCDRDKLILLSKKKCHCHDIACAAKDLYLTWTVVHITRLAGPYC